MHVAFFDLDRTLIDCNSGRLWMQSEWRAGRLGWRNVIWASYWISKYHLGFGGGLEEAYTQAVMTLKGLEESVLEERNARWFAAEVRHRLRPGALTTLQMHRARGDRLVLATSASVYEARLAAETWGLEPGISTAFGVSEGCFTGEISSWAFGDHKRTRALEWLEAEGMEPEQATFYSDSATDLGLLALVGHPVAVNPDRKLTAIARARGWEMADWGLSSPQEVPTQG